MKKILAVLVLVALQFGCASSPLKNADGNKDVETAAGEEKSLSYIDFIGLRLNEVWSGLTRDRLPSLRVATQKSTQSKWTVRVIASVSASGEVKKVKVSKTSGVKEIDEMGVAAFMVASPLAPPPPRSLKNGIALVPWDFNLVK